MKALTFISLFSGIGGLDLGLERAGLRCVAQVEIDPYACKVLAKHWPDVIRFGDIRTVGAYNLPAADCLVGGFPCQDISNAGKRAGIGGERSGLWAEYARLIGELRPRYVLVENVPALLNRGMGTVLGDLAARRYDAEWQVLGADRFGASQHRERLWILAYPHNARRQGAIGPGQSPPPWHTGPVAYSEPLRSTGGLWPPGPCAVADIPRMVDGPAHRVDRLRTLGNAVVPQVAEYIGRALVAFDAAQEVAA